MADEQHAEAVAALARGDLAGWHGLPADLEEAALSAALGPGGAEVPSSLAGLPAVNRTYPPAAAAPFGVKAWFEGSEVLALEIREPPLAAPIEEQIGAPDAIVRSRLGTTYSQHVYATRGLALHISDVTGEVRRLYTFPPSDAETFLASPLGGVEERRIPRI